MVQKVIEYVRNELKRAREELEKAKEIQRRLKAAGEDTSKEDIEIAELERKIEAYEAAFSEEE